MDFVLNRRGGVSIRDQLVAQLELKILCGDLAPGRRLPSVRALARRLKVHANTVSAAYQDLEAAGQVKLRRGSGVFVRDGAPATLEQARGLDEMIRMALHAAFRKGFSGPAIRSAVERWLAASPPDRVVVVDSVRETAELIVHEISSALRVQASTCTLAELERDTAALSGALAVVTPYHQETLGRLVPEAALEVVNLELTDEDRKAILRLPQGAIVLLVSHSPAVLSFGSVLFRSLRGDELLVETRLLSAAREWKRLLPAADLVAADALAAESVRRSGARKLREVRIVSAGALARLRETLDVVVPRRAP
jgi:DNA-binding transcriptional regulator YhcF (GntR family)